MDERLKIAAGLEIDLSALQFSASRSSGPGGQHVNKTSSRITLRFNVLTYPEFTEGQRARILQKLKNRINGAGEILIHVQDERSQLANRELAVLRLQKLLADALHRDPPRRKTRVPRAARQKRMDAKSHRGSIKKMRRRPDAE